MAEYIDREAALDIVNGWREQLIPTYGKNDEYVKCLETVAEHLETLPAADVVERNPLPKDVEDLVERLKIAAEWAGKGFCITPNLCLEAAAAIEELEKSVPRWIPVKEQLPKTRESILGKKSSKVIVAFRFDDGTQGTDTAHTLNGEWVFEDHIIVVPRTITHWMPLPGPPKEET